MKNTVRLFGIIAIVVIIGFGMTACDDGGDEQQDIYTVEDVEVTTAGRLTITGLDNHNGTSISASGTTNDGNEYTTFVAYGYVYKKHQYKNGNVTDIFSAQYEQGTISGGQVILKVYVRSYDNDDLPVYENYAGNHQNLQFSVSTYNPATWNCNRELF